MTVPTRRIALAGRGCRCGAGNRCSSVIHGRRPTGVRTWRACSPARALRWHAPQKERCGYGGADFNQTLLIGAQAVGPHCEGRRGPVWHPGSGLNLARGNAYACTTPSRP